jgi:hypothetical protein
MLRITTLLRSQRTRQSARLTMQFRLRVFVLVL